MRHVVKAIVCSALPLALAASGADGETLQLAVDGVTRTYLIERPAIQEPRPTIIMLHGAGGNAAQEARSTGLGELAPRHGLVAVFPEGRGGRWNHLPPGVEAAQFVRVFDAYGGPPDDVSFLKSLVADLIRRGLSDPKRIFLAGESAGGIMALRMVCADAELFAGLGLLIAAMPEPIGTGCDPAKPLPVLMINGTADQVLPFAGGPSAPPDRAFPSGAFNVWSTERLVGFFERLNICVAAAERSAAPGFHQQQIEIEQYSQCGGGPVVSYRIVGGGHAVPADLDAGQLLLNFFR